MVGLVEPAHCLEPRTIDDQACARGVVDVAGESVRGVTRVPSMAEGDRAPVPPEQRPGVLDEIIEAQDERGRSGHAGVAEAG